MVENLADPRCRVAASPWGELNAAAVEDMALFGATHPDAETLLPQAIDLNPCGNHHRYIQKLTVLIIVYPFFIFFAILFLAIKTDHILLNPMFRNLRLKDVEGITTVSRQQREWGSGWIKH